jgi:hemerythrin-like domain-containing protein
MNIFQALMVSHATQRELAQQLMANIDNPAERDRVFLELKRELIAHETAEERFFYVPLIQHDDTVDDSRHAIAEHHQMDEMVECMDELARSSGKWHDVARKLCDKIEHHLKEEEQKFFPDAGQVLSDEEKISLAGEYEAEFERLRAKAEEETT